MTKLYERAALVEDEGDRICASAAHLAIAMRLAFYGKSSLSELQSYLSREGIRATTEEVIAVLEEYTLDGFLLGGIEAGYYDAGNSLVELVKKRAPSRAHLESKAKPLLI